MWTGHILFVQSDSDGHLGCLHLLATVNSNAVNMGVSISIQDPVFSFLGYITRSGISRSYGN